MPAINDLLSQIQQTFLQELMPTPARKIGEIGTNQFGQVRFGDGNVIIGYNAAGMPLTMKVSGADEDLAVLQSPYIDHVRMVEVGDPATAQKLADMFESLFGAALVLDEPNRRRIRRAARTTSGNNDVPAGMIRDRVTGELRPRMKPGRRRE